MEAGEPCEFGIARQCIAQRHRAVDGQIADEAERCDGPDRLQAGSGPVRSSPHRKAHHHD